MHSKIFDFHRFHAIELSAELSTRWSATAIRECFLLFRVRDGKFFLESADLKN